MSQTYAFKLYVGDELSKYGDWGAAKIYAESLTVDGAQFVCEALSNLRKNGVYRFIADNPGDWSTEIAPVEEIKINRINATVDPLLERHGFNLARCASDAAIAQRPEFSSNRRLIPPETVFLAKRDAAGFTLMDGNHRAIRLAVEGAATLTLLRPGPPTITLL